MNLDDLQALCLMLGGKEFLPGMPPLIYHFDNFDNGGVTRVVVRTRREILVGTATPGKDYLCRSYKEAAKIILARSGRRSD